MTKEELLEQIKKSDELIAVTKALLEIGSSVGMEPGETELLMYMKAQELKLIRHGLKMKLATDYHILIFD